MKGKNDKNELRKKSGLTIKVPVSELEMESVYDKVKKHLQKNPKYAYTRAGLMVELYGYKAEDLNKPFNEWKKGAPTLYTRIRLALERLEKEGLINSKKEGKKYLYWWRSEETEKKE